VHCESSVAVAVVGTVREPRKVNIRRWKPVPEDMMDSRPRGLSVCIVNYRQTVDCVCNSNRL
jgi:hypothetical protein